MFPAAQAAHELGEAKEQSGADFCLCGLVSEWGGGCLGRLAHAFRDAGGVSAVTSECGRADDIGHGGLRHPGGEPVWYVRIDPAPDNSACLRIG